MWGSKDRRSARILEPSSILLPKDARKVGWRKRHIGSPNSKPTMLIYGLDPFREELALCSVLLTFLAFHFQYQHFTVLQTDEVIGAVFEDYPLK